MFAAAAVLDDIEIVERPRKPRLKLARTAAVVSVAAAAVPAHGFVVSGKGLVAPSVSRFTQTPLWGWFRTFLGACAWAAMMAAGMLVYQHFVHKWEERGFPVLPVAALTAATQQAGSGKPLGPIHLGSGKSSSSSAPQEKSRQTSFLDEYEG